MEREFGAEVVKAFGARLKRLYESDEQTLPSQFQTLLERLKRREGEGTAGVFRPHAAGAAARCEE